MKKVCKTLVAVILILSMVLPFSACTMPEDKTLTFDADLNTLMERVRSNGYTYRTVECEAPYIVEHYKAILMPYYGGDAYEDDYNFDFKNLNLADDEFIEIVVFENEEIAQYCYDISMAERQLSLISTRYEIDAMQYNVETYASEMDPDFEQQLQNDKWAMFEVWEYYAKTNYAICGNVVIFGNGNALKCIAGISLPNEEENEDAGVAAKVWFDSLPVFKDETISLEHIEKALSKQNYGMDTSENPMLGLEKALYARDPNPESKGQGTVNVLEFKDEELAKIYYETILLYNAATFAWTSAYVSYGQYLASQYPEHFERVFSEGELDAHLYALEHLKKCAISGNTVVIWDEEGEQDATKALSFLDRLGDTVSGFLP